MISFIKSLFGVGERVLDKVLPDVKQSRSEQVGMNVEEARSGPRLHWRMLLGYLLVLSFAYEVWLRPWMVWYDPSFDSMPRHSSEIITLLKHMLGVGGLW